jgi:hypothetical protein
MHCRDRHSDIAPVAVHGEPFSTPIGVGAVGLVHAGGVGFIVVDTHRPVQ